MNIQIYVYMNKINITIGAILLIGIVSIGGIDQAQAEKYSDDEENDSIFDSIESFVDQNFNNDNQVKQVNENGDNYVVIEQPQGADFSENREQNNYDYHDVSDTSTSSSSSGDLKVIVEIDDGGEVCLWKDRYGEDDKQLDCGSLNGAGEIIFETNEIPVGEEFKVCLDGECKSGTNGEEKEPERITFD